MLVCTTEPSPIELVMIFLQNIYYTCRPIQLKLGSGILHPTIWYFHQLGPLGRVGLVVAKSVCVFVWCLCVCPIPMRFFLRPLIGPVITWSVWGLSLGGRIKGAEKRGKKKNYHASYRKKKKSCNLFKFVLVLLSASVERVCVSRMRDFFYIA